MTDFEIKIDSLDARSMDMLKTLGYIIEADWDAGMDLAYATDGFSEVKEAIGKVRRSLNDIKETLRLEAESIAIRQGAEPGNFVTFLDIFNNTVATLNIDANRQTKERN